MNLSRPPGANVRRPSSFVIDERNLERAWNIRNQSQHHPHDLFASFSSNSTFSQIFFLSISLKCRLAIHGGGNNRGQNSGGGSGKGARTCTLKSGRFALFWEFETGEKLRNMEEYKISLYIDIFKNSRCQSG